MHPLSKLGWNENLNKEWNDSDFGSFEPARIVADYGSSYRVGTPEELNAEISGRFLHDTEAHNLPKIGDWVAIERREDGKGIIRGVLSRRSEISRRQPGEQYQKQILAANIDVAFLVQALDNDFSPERLERYLFQLNQEGVETILVLNKADKSYDTDEKIGQLKALNVPVLVTSAKENIGMESIANAIKPGNTAVFLGSSGVGKSTITNRLLGQERQATQIIRKTDATGQHTTSHRELFILPNGGLIIDTPGLRELQLWGTEEDLQLIFADIDSLSKHCKFNDCSHLKEPDCAVRQAIDAGTLEEARLTSYTKLKTELRFLNTKIDKDAKHELKRIHKNTQKQHNQISRHKKEIKKG